MRFLTILILGLILGYFASYVGYFHTIPPWMVYSSLGGVIGSIMGILLLPPSNK